MMQLVQWEAGIFIHQCVSNSFSVCIFENEISKLEYFALSLSIAPPTYEESEYKAKIADKNDTEHTRGQTEFAPRYPIFSGAALPPLPNTNN